MRRIATVVVVGLVLAGCATRYQEMGATGGVTVTSVVTLPNVYSISVDSSTVSLTRTQK